MVERTVPSCFLSGLPVKTWALIQAVNLGWSWEALVPAWVGDPVTLGEATLSGSQVWSMRLLDGRGWSSTSPPLVACTGIDWLYGDGQELVQLSGTDLTTWKLSQPHQSLPTFRNLYANTVIATIAAAAGVHIVAPQLNFAIAEEDVKQSNWWDPLHRIAEVAVSNWIVDCSGTLRLVPLQWTAEAVYYKPKSVSYRHIPEKRVTGFVINKRTSHYTADVVPDKPYTWDTPGVKVQQLRVPVVNPQCQDLSTLGSIGSVGFWDEDPSKAGSRLIKFCSLGDNSYGAILTVPVNGTGPAKYMTLVVYPASPPLDVQPVTAKLRVSGSTPPAVAGLAMPGLDLAFTATVGIIKGQGVRPGPVRNEALYPSKAWVEANANRLLYEANKAASQVDASDAIDCTACLCGRLLMNLPRTVPAARIERIEERGSAEEFSTSLQGFVIPW